MYIQLNSILNDFPRVKVLQLNIRVNVTERLPAKQICSTFSNDYYKKSFITFMIERWQKLIKCKGEYFKKKSLNDPKTCKPTVEQFFIKPYYKNDVATLALW